MLIGEKLEMINYILDVKDYSYWNDVSSLYYKINELINDYDEEIRGLQKLRREYNFFETLSKQTDIDDIISLMKIADRLDVEMPQLQIDFENIEETYDLIWIGIGEQVPLSDELKSKIQEFAIYLIANEPTLSDCIEEEKLIEYVDWSRSIASI